MPSHVPLVVSHPSSSRSTFRLQLTWFLLLLLSVIALFLVLPAWAGQQVYLVKDINPTTNGSYPADFVVGLSYTFFTANDGTHGEELWRTDGTAAGTVMLKDIGPGDRMGYVEWPTTVSKRLFFVADDGTHGRELWKSDGTPQGTVLVKDILPGSSSPWPRNFVNVNGTLFFAANSQTGKGDELWKSDGTADGTVPIKGLDALSQLTAASGRLYFTADDGSSGVELWASDGTASGTVVVKDIVPGAGSASPTQLTSVNGSLFFVVNDATTGAQLWKSDGTTAGTVQVATFGPTSVNQQISWLTNANSLLYFVADTSSSGREFWKSDGTAAGTVQVADIASGTGSSEPSQLTNVNGTLFFVANDGRTGRELWRSDGTLEGTLRVTDIVSGTGSANISALTATNDGLIFVADDGTTGAELWRSDGTTMGTALMQDLLPGPASSIHPELKFSGQHVFFGATDGTSGFELWALPTLNGSVGEASPPPSTPEATTVPATSTPVTATATPTTSSPIAALSYRVIDAEYSRALDRIVMVAEAPDQLHIYNPATHSTVSVALPRPPLNVSVGPDGRFAAVGHAGLVSYVDLQQGVLVKTLNVTATAADVVLAGNGKVYVSPASDQWVQLRAIDIATNTEVLHTGYSIRAGTVYKLHPDGRSLYGANRGLTPSDIEKIDISVHPPAYLYDSPYHGDYPMCGDLWMAEDGLRIFTACGNVFRASAVRSQDMTYNGSLASSGLSSIRHLTHSSAAGRVLAIANSTSTTTQPGDDQVRIVSYEHLQWERSVVLPKYQVGTQSYSSHGRFVFANAAGTEFYTIVQADPNVGLLYDYGVVTNPMVLTPTPTATPVPPTPTPTNGSPIAALSYRVIDAEYSHALDRIVMVSEASNQLHIYNPASRATVSVALPRPPLAVSVGPDGRFAAVGHDALVSYVDLQQGVLVKTLDVTAAAADVVLAGNGKVYVSPVRDQSEQIRAIDIATNTEVLHSGRSIYASSRIKLHPDGRNLYNTNRGLSPSDIEKIDISVHPPAYLYDSPYHGDYEVCGDLWMAEDGLRIFTACGNVFRASAVRSQDMTYNGSLASSGLSSIRHLTHSSAAGRVLAIANSTSTTTQPGDDQVRIVSYEHLQWERSVVLPKYQVGTQSYSSHGRFVFANAAGTEFYTIVQADPNVGLLYDYGVVTNPMVLTPTPTATPVPTSTPISTNTPTTTPTAVNTPTMTATATSTATATATPTAAATTPPQNSLLVEDRFSRSVTNGWGSATTGGAYTHVGGSTSDYAVDGSSGSMLIGTAGSASRNSLLLGTVAQDIDISMRVKTDKAATGGGPMPYVIGRRISSGNEYRGRLRVTSTGKIMVQAVRVSGGVETFLGTEGASGVTHSANTYIRMRMQITGTHPTTIRLKAWIDGQAEPNTWQQSVTDGEANLQTSGAVGLRAYLPSTSTNAPVRFTFDDLSVALPSSGTTATPLPSPTLTPTIAPTRTAAPTPTSAPTPTATSTTGPNVTIKAISFEDGCLSGSTCATGADKLNGTGASLAKTGLVAGSTKSALVNGNAYFTENFTPVDNLYAAFYLKLHALPSSTVRIAQIRNRNVDGTSTTVGELHVTSQGVLRLQQGGSSTVIGSSTALALGSVYRIGLVQKKGTGNNGVLQAYIISGNAPFAAPFAQRTSGTWTTRAANFTFALTNANTQTINATFDDVKLDSAAMPLP